MRGGGEGVSCNNVTIYPHDLPIALQIAPIDYGNYVTTCPISIVYIIYNKNAAKFIALVLFYV